MFINEYYLCVELFMIKMLSRVSRNKFNIFLLQTKVIQNQKTHTLTTETDECLATVHFKIYY